MAQSIKLYVGCQAIWGKSASGMATYKIITIKTMRYDCDPLNRYTKYMFLVYYSYLFDTESGHE